MSIEGQQRILDLSEIEYLLKNEESIALGECYCRKKYKKCDGPIEVCLNLNKEAENFIAKGLAKKVNLDKALEALQCSHEAGLVHIAYTFKGNENPEVICSCCSCCCHSMSASVRFGMPDGLLKARALARE